MVSLWGRLKQGWLGTLDYLLPPDAVLPAVRIAPVVPLVTPRDRLDRLLAAHGLEDRIAQRAGSMADVVAVLEVMTRQIDELRFGDREPNRG